MSPPSSHRDLLLGLMALKLALVSHENLRLAASAMASDPSQTLGKVLIQQVAISPEEVTLLEQMVEQHLQRHAGDAAGWLNAGTRGARERGAGQLEPQYHRRCAAA